MSEQRHIIKRQIIELTVQDSAAAPALQDEVSRVYHQRIVPFIDQCCSELSQPDRVYRIESLELDLGILDTDNLEEQFVAKANTALRKALTTQINRQEQDALQAKPSPKMLSALELFVFFVRTGGLPWWADDSQPELLAENLEQLLHETPQELRRLLQMLAREGRSRQRIVNQYSDGQLAQLCGLLLPAYQLSFAQDTQALITTLQKTKTAAAWPPSRFRQSAWSNLLQVAALGGQQYPMLEAFYRAVLARVAPELGSTGSALMAEIRQVLQDGQAGGGASARQFKELFEALTRVTAGTPASVSEELVVRLAQLQAAGEGPLVGVWAGLQALAPRLSDPLQAQWLAALDVLGNGPSPRRVLQLLRSELGAQPSAELSRLAEMLQSVLGMENETQAAPMEIGKELAARLQYCQSGGGPLAEVWAALRVLGPRLPPRAQAAWLEILKDLRSETAAERILRLLNAEPVQHGLRPEERTNLLEMLRAAGEPEYTAHETPLDLRFSDADEISVANAGLVILWPFLAGFFTHLGLLEEKEFKDLAARQRAVGLLQVIATKDTTPPEYLLPLNKLLCGLEPQQVFDFGPPLLRSEAKECKNLLKAVIAQAPILHNMSAAGFRGTFLLRPGLLSLRDGLWLLRVERQSYDIVLERFPWNWQWVKLPWMETPLRVEW